MSKLEKKFFLFHRCECRYKLAHSSFSLGKYSERMKILFCGRFLMTLFFHVIGIDHRAIFTLSSIGKSCQTRRRRLQLNAHFHVIHLSLVKHLMNDSSISRCRLFETDLTTGSITKMCQYLLELIGVTKAVVFNKMLVNSISSFCSPSRYGIAVAK